MAECTRASLGQEVALGTLYDARLDQFLSGFILPPNAPRGSVLTIPCTHALQHENSTSVGSTHAARFEAMGIDHKLAASVLSGLVEPKGSATFLKDGHPDKLNFFGAVRHIYNTREERLNLNEPRFLDVASVGDYRSTHVVTGIKWGLQSIMTMKHKIDLPNQRPALEASFRRDLGELTAIAESLPSLNFDDNFASNRLKLDYELKLYSDVQRDYGMDKQTLSIMCRFVQLGPQQIRGRDGKGHIISYTLLPIHLLRQLLSGTTAVPNNLPPPEPIIDIIPFLNLFDEFNEAHIKVEEYQILLRSKKQYVAKDHIGQVDMQVTSLFAAHRDLKNNLSQAVMKAKDGTLDNRFISHVHAASMFAVQTTYQVEGRLVDLIKFVDEAVDSGATYIGFNGLSLRSIIISPDIPAPWLFRFNNNVLKNSSSWEDQRLALMEHLWTPNGRGQVYILDSEAFPEDGHLARADFHKLPGFDEVMADDSKRHGSPTIREPMSRQITSSRYLRKLFVSCSPEDLDTSPKPRPTDRYPVRIPCPGSCCNQHSSREWTCIECNAVVEFGLRDDHIYCDCGRALYKRWSFRCNRQSGAGSSKPYRSRDLHKLLLGMHQPTYRNILVLGETGVGKSTFINAFYNFLKFDGFDEAKAANKAYLEFAVPCSFSLNLADPSNPYGEFTNKRIPVGPQDDETEQDGNDGDSATQRTSIYEMRYRDTTYRLIDTPGIGDTRGPEQDKMNMRGILDTLSRYKELHGILILLKTDQSRLTATFKFCFDELLSHIHRSAVANITFGFTHSRSSNYAPGQSLGPLKRLLAKHTDINLTLSPSNAYCFDAESFRYLAAYHYGVKEEDETIYQKSWGESRTATLKFLEHVGNLDPHDISQMLGMYEVRRAIGQLMIPMVDVSREIRRNVDLVKEKIKELDETRLTGEKLREKLHFERIKLDPKKLDMPRTVCTNNKCCDFKMKGNGEITTIYRTVCHENCRLPNITGDCLGASGLIKCKAFKKNKARSCDVCGHHWQQHMHYLYELIPIKERVKDIGIEDRLKQNIGDVALREGRISELHQDAEEYKDERTQLRKATALFVRYLKDNAIMPVNDATEEYYDQLIQVEQNTIQAGKEKKLNVDVHKRNLKNLQHDKRAYLELVETIKMNMHSHPDSEERLSTKKDIEKVISNLYNLKHSGGSLRKIEEVITASKIAGAHEQHDHHQRFTLLRRSSSLIVEPGRSGS
ncbi:hypothetical protein ACHAPU_001952 [Fusarium lateritium]